MNNGTRAYEQSRKFVRANWETMTDDEMARHLILTVPSIRRLRYRMGFKRDVPNKKFVT